MADSLFSTEPPPSTGNPFADPSFGPKTEASPAAPNPFSDPNFGQPKSAYEELKTGLKRFTPALEQATAATAAGAQEAAGKPIDELTAATLKHAQEQLEANKLSPEEHGWIVNTLAKVPEAAASFLPMAGAQFAGEKVGGLGGLAVGGPVGGAAGAIGGGAAAVAAQQYAQTYHDALHEALDAGKSGEAAAEYARNEARLQGRLGAAFGAIPLVGPAARLGARALGFGARTAEAAVEAGGEATAKRFLPELGKRTAEGAAGLAAYNVASEVGTQPIREEAGLPSVSTGEAVKQGLMGTVEGGIAFLPFWALRARTDARTAAAVRDALADPKVPGNQRLEAAQHVYSAMADVNKDAADQWADNAAKAIDQGKEVGLTGDWATGPHPSVNRPIQDAADLTVQTGAAGQKQAEQKIAQQEATEQPKEPTPEEEIRAFKEREDAEREAEEYWQQQAGHPRALFPFPSPEAAQSRAMAAEQASGVPHQVVPHPYVRDRYAVVPTRPLEAENAATAREQPEGGEREREGAGAGVSGQGEDRNVHPGEQEKGGEAGGGNRPVEEAGKPSEGPVARWDFRKTFPEVNPESKYAQDLLTAEDPHAALKGLHDETSIELVARLNDADALREAIATGNDPNTGKPVKENKLADAKKQWTEGLKQEEQGFKDQLAEYHDAFGPEAAAAFEKHVTDMYERLNAARAAREGKARVEPEPHPAPTAEPSAEKQKEPEPQKAPSAASEQAKADLKQGIEELGQIFGEPPKEPTPAQAAAGNYEKDHIKVHGLDISIENREGTTRKSLPGVEPAWEQKIARADYGYIRGTVGRDKDHIDAFVKPGTKEDHAGDVYVIDQKNQKTGAFDEHKVMIGYVSAADALRAYKSNYPKGWEAGAMTKATPEQFKEWLKTGDTKKPFLPPAAEPPKKERTEAQKAVDEKLRARALGRKEIHEDSDSTMAAVIKSGGIRDTHENRLEVTGDTKLNPRLAFVGTLFQKDGMGIDQLARELGPDNGRHYMSREEMDDVDGGVQALKDKLRDELGGIKTHYSLKRDPEADLRSRLDEEEIKDSGFDNLTPEEKAAVAETLTEDYADIGGKVLSDAEVENWLREGPSEAERAATVAEGEGARGREETGAGAAEEGTAHNPLTFSSGMSRPGDFTAALAAGKHVGIEIGELSDASIPKIADALARAPDAQLFVDTGAFSLFKANERAKASGQQTFEDFPDGGRGIDWKETFDRFDALQRELSKASEDQGGEAVNRVHWVMPDVVGNQKASLDLLREHEEEIRSYVEFGFNPIIPLQKGERSLAEAYDEAVKIIGRDGLTVGIPSNEKAVTTEEFRDFMREVGNRIGGVHFLGAASEKTAGPKLDVLREIGFDGQVSMDANRLRSAMYGETDRAAAMRKILQPESEKFTISYGGEKVGGFELAGETNADILAKEHAARLKAEKEAEEAAAAAAKEAADRERDKFTLAGSDRPADVLAAQGQTGLFEQPAEKPTEVAADRPAATPAEPSLEQRIATAEEEIRRLEHAAGWAAEERLREMYGTSSPRSHGKLLKADQDRLAAWREEELAKRKGQIDKAQHRIEIWQKQAKAQGDLKAALGDLGDWAAGITGAKKNITPEQEQKLLPILTRVMDAAFRAGYYKFVDAARHVLEQIRGALGDHVADAIPLEHLQGAYVAMSHRYKGEADGPGEVFGVKSKGELEAPNAASGRTDLEPNSEAGTQEPVWGAVPASGSGPAHGRAPEGVRAAGEPGGAAGGGDRVSDVRAAGGRAGGDLGVREGEPEHPAGPPRNDLGRGGPPAGDTSGSTQRSPDRAATDVVQRAAGSDSERVDQQRAADKTEVKPRDRANIGATLPYLHPQQQDDVHFAEERFAKPKGYGVLFTNGTGTGKTFTGLGAIKRFVRQGKDDVLVVAPNDNVIQAWQRSARKLGIELRALASTEDSGRGPTITTYANFGQNTALGKRRFHLIVPDESHYLSANQEGGLTNAGMKVRAHAMHPEWYMDTAELRDPALNERVRAVNDPKSLATAEERAKVNTEWRAHTERVQEELAAMRDEDRPRVLMLSATPFAYRQSIDYAQGLLFDWNEGADLSRQGAYNAADAREQFYIRHFGYRMRYGRMEQPDAKVNTALMEQNFNTWLKQQGVLSSRVLDVDADYSRNFALVDDAIGKKIDEGMEWLRDNYDPLYRHLLSGMKYIDKMFLLESMKARHAIPLVQEQLDAGKKVMVFHDFNKGGGFHPFHFEGMREDDEPYTWNQYGPGGKAETKTMTGRQLVEAFERERPDLTNMDFSGLTPPISQFEKAFGEKLLKINGLESVKDRREALAKFNADETGPQVMLTQADAGKEGISAHDTTGKHQRVMFNLGMPIKPTQAVQQEGRTYRVGQVTDAPFLYFNTGTNFERWTFAHKIAERAGTAENLALGDLARRLRESFIQSFDDARAFEPDMVSGVGGKEADARVEPLNEFAKAKTYYYAEGKKTARDKSREGIDYFATPEPLGLKMVEWANIKPGEKVLEPSAGHGAIARWFPENTDRTIIEPSSKLASRTALVTPGARAIDDRFENHHVGANKYDAIVMNPPFGVGGKTAYEHLAKAFDHLHDRGRIVAIVPDGPAANARFEKWLDSDDSHGAHVVADMKLPSSAFERAGTNVNARLLIIDRYFNAKEAPGESIQRDYRSAEDVNQFFDRIEHAEVPPRTEPPSGAISATPPATADAQVALHRLLPPEAPDAIVGPAQHMVATATGERTVGANPATKWTWETPKRVKLPGPAIDAVRGWLEANSEKSKALGTGQGRQYTVRLTDDDPEKGISSKMLVQVGNGGINIRRWRYEYDNPIQAAPGEFRTGETTHGKTGEPVFVAALGQRVDNARYSELVQLAKANNGYYSSFKGGNAIPGFQFKSAEDRAQFLTDAKGDKLGLGGEPGGMTRYQVAAEANRITAALKNAPEVRVVDTAADLPRPAPDVTRGQFYGGKVYLVAKNLRDDQAVQHVVLHEVMGHYGLKGVLGDQLDPLMGRIYETNPEVRAMADARREQYAEKGRELTIAGATEEALADLAAEGRVNEVRGWRVLVAAVRTALRKLGFNLEMSDNDVAVLLSRARRFAEAEAPPELRSLETGRVGEAAPTITKGVAALAEQRFSMDGKLMLDEPPPRRARIQDMPDWVKPLPQEFKNALLKTSVVTERRTIRERVEEFRKDAGTRILQGMVDQFRPVLTKIGEYEYKLLRLSQSSDAGLLAAIKYGTPYMNKYGAIDVKPGSKSLLQVLKPLNGETQRFLAWIAGHRAEQLAAEDREHLFEDVDIRALQRLNQQLHPEDNFPTGESGVGREKIYNAVLEEFSAFNKQVMDIAEAAGLIKGDERHLWEHQFYVPFYRIAEEDQAKYPGNVSGMVNQYAFKRLKGGREFTQDLLGNAVHNWNHLLNAALKNNAGVQTLRKAVDLGIAEHANMMTGEFFVREDGERKYYTVNDPLVAQAIKSLEPTPFYGPAMRSMQWFRHALTVGTTASPVFRLRHTIREQITALAANPTSYNFVKNWLDGLKYSSHTNPVYGSMLAGGSFFPMGLRLEENQARAVKEMLYRDLRDPRVLNSPEKVKHALTSMWDWWKDVGERADSITRANLYRQEYARRVALGEPPEKAHFEASYVARDAMDYSLHGTYAAVRLLTRVVPFMNARMQGIYKLGRGLEQDPKRFAAVVGGVTLATIALSLAYRNDKKMQAIEEWKRDNYWNFRVGDNVFSIPKPFELGALGTVVDRAVETALNGFDPISRERFVNRLWPIIGGQLNLNPIPQAFYPFMQVWANKDVFFGRSIETEHDLTLTPPNRIGPNTSMLARGASKAMYSVLPEKLTLSPKQIDWLVNAFFGWVGAHAVAASDLALRPIFGQPSRPAPRVDDYFVVGDFVKSLPVDQSRFVEQFYEHLRQVQEAFGDMRQAGVMAAAQHNPELVHEAFAEHRPELMVHTEYVRTQRQIASLDRLTRTISAKDLPPDVKRQQLERLAQTRAQLALIAESARARAYGAPGP